MRSKFGGFLMFLGTLMIAGALALFLMNREEQARAAAASGEAIPKVVEAIQQRTQEQKQEEAIPDETQVPTAPPIKVMAVEEIDGHGYIGFVSIPALELELPVMTDWTYPQLQIAPCRYSGSTYTDDLVIMAHNYEKHFGKLSKLKLGDVITFTDMDAGVWEYEVVAKDVLSPTAVEDMTAGEYDLTLFTCTYGGENRITVRCDKLSDY